MRNGCRKVGIVNGTDRIAPAWTGRDTRLALGAVLLFWAAAALVWPLTGSVVPWDSKNHFYPMLRYLGIALEHGELPLWNPYHFSGHPSVADPQSLLFTPTMLLFAWAVPSPSMQLFDLVVFAHLLPGALATIMLFRRRDWRPAGAVVAGGDTTVVEASTSSPHETNTTSTTIDARTLRRMRSSWAT